MSSRLLVLLAAAASLATAACLLPPAQSGQPAYGDPAGTYSQPENTSAAPSPAPAARPAPAAPAAPSVVSVTLRSSCSSTVRVFFGDKPKFGSGTYSTLSSNSRTSRQFRPGDMVWIVDQSDNGLASATVSDRTSEIEVTSSCTGLSAR